MNLTAELRNLGDVRAPDSLRLSLLGDAYAEIDSEMGRLLSLSTPAASRQSTEPAGPTTSSSGSDAGWGAR